MRQKMIDHTADMSKKNRFFKEGMLLEGLAVAYVAALSEAAVCGEEADVVAGAASWSSSAVAAVSSGAA